MNVPWEPPRHVWKSEPHQVTLWGQGFKSSAQGQTVSLSPHPPPSSGNAKGAMNVSEVAWDDTRNPSLHGNVIICAVWEELRECHVPAWQPTLSTRL